MDDQAKNETLGNNTGEVLATMKAGAERSPDAPAAINLAALGESITANKPFRLELKHPITKKPLGAFLHILSYESERVQTYIKANLDDRLVQEDYIRRRGEEVEPVLTPEMEKRAIDLLEVATVGWEGVSVEAGVAESAFNSTNVRKLYTFKSWRQQANAGMENLQNFI